MKAFLFLSLFLSACEICTETISAVDVDTKEIKSVQIRTCQESSDDDSWWYFWYMNNIIIMSS